MQGTSLGIFGRKKKEEEKKTRILTVGKTHIDFIQIEKNT